MIPASDTKNCQACGKPVRGRSDKKFCDDNCRNQFNNQLNAPGNNFMRITNSALRKNRSILESLLPDTNNTIRLSREKLQHMGFRFQYHTHVARSRKGRAYRFCYEYGYYLKGKEVCIVRKKC